MNATSTNGRHTLERTTFTTSRLLDFCSQKELVAQTGHEPGEWPLVVLKELMDNALDACEDARTPPVVAVRVDAGGIEVSDNGPGIPPEVVAKVLDFSVRVSSREAYVSPCRGAQGNALKTIVAMPYVLDGEQGMVEVAARGIRHTITMRLDRIRQAPAFDHRQEPDASVTSGTLVRVHWPDSPRSEAGAVGARFLQVDDEDEEDDEGEWSEDDDSPWSTLAGARARFLQLADDYTFFNPHLSLTVDWFGKRTTVPASNAAWKKWLPSDPTSAHWYKPEHFERLVSAYIAHDADRGRDRTVRELVKEFHGLSGTAKQKAVLEATGLTRTNLSALVTDGRLDSAAVARLLDAMQQQSKSVKPQALGLIGKEHLAGRFEALGCQMESFSYVKTPGEHDGAPYVIEVAFGVLAAALDRSQGDKRRRIVAGLNWSPGIKNPFRSLGRFGQSLDSVLAQQRVGRDEPVIFALHVAYPRVQYTDRGKSAVVIGGVGDSPR
jgi:hypothetical protein